MAINVVLSGGVPLYLNYNIIAEVEMGVISKFAR